MKKDETLNMVSAPGTKRRGMPRRDFFKLIGSGIIVCFMPRCASDGTPAGSSAGKRSPEGL